MDQAAHEIESHIERTRERLGSNLRELEHRVEAATDWRTQFRARPHVFLVAAFAGGALLAGAFGPKSARLLDDAYPEVRPRPLSGNGGNVQERALELWNDVKDALISVAGIQIKNYIAEVVPGVAEHFQRTAGTNPAAADRGPSASRQS